MPVRGPGVNFGTKDADSSPRYDMYGSVPPRPLPRHVVFIGFDGLSGTILSARPESMPTLAGLKARAAWTYSSRAVLPTYSTCNWRSLYTCSATDLAAFAAAILQAFPER